MKKTHYILFSIFAIISIVLSLLEQSWPMFLILLGILVFAFSFLFIKDAALRQFSDWLDTKPGFINFLGKWFMPQKFFYQTCFGSLAVGFSIGLYLSLFIIFPTVKYDPDVFFVPRWGLAYVLMFIFSEFTVGVTNIFYSIYDVIDAKRDRQKQNGIERRLNKGEKIEFLKCPMCGREKDIDKSRCQKCGYQF